MAPESKEQNDVKLEDILKSIKNMIDSPNNVFDDSSDSSFKEDMNSKKKKAKAGIGDIAEGENILELTSIVRAGDGFNNKDTLLSEETASKAKSEIDKFASTLKETNYSKDAIPFEAVLNKLMLPLMRSWFDANLPQIVERVVEQEIKKIIPKSGTRK